MDIARLLTDASGLPAEGATRRQVHLDIANKLNAAYGSGSITLKGVAKWEERGSIPSTWLLRVCALPQPNLNAAAYA